MNQEITDKEIKKILNHCKRKTHALPKGLNYGLMPETIIKRKNKLNFSAMTKKGQRHYSMIN